MTNGVKIELKKTCTLARFGYRLRSTKADRRKALVRAIKAYGSRYVIQKLVVLRTYRKAKRTPTDRRFYRALDADIRAVQAIRDGMTATARSRDLATSRAWSATPSNQKVFCS
ncbi:MAG: hypothetical protein ACO27L_03560 [Schleiferiaceae bacterium]